MFRPPAAITLVGVGRWATAFAASLPAVLRPALLLALALLFAVHPPALAQTVVGSGPHHAGLVVRFADGHVKTRCVAFSEPSITGEELLARSEFRAIINPTGALGGAVCSIDGQGCSYPSQDCFCKCVGLQCEYWAYYHWADAGSAAGPGWQYSQNGASTYQVTDLALEGWSWGPGNFSSGTEPPKIAFAGVCPAGATASAGATAGLGVAAAKRPAGPADPAQYAAFALLAGLLTVIALLVRRRRGAS